MLPGKWMGGNMFEECQNETKNQVGGEKKMCICFSGTGWVAARFEMIIFIIRDDSHMFMGQRFNGSGHNIVVWK